VDNRGGAAGIIGSDIVAKSVPDGHTIMLTSTTHLVNASLYSKLPYDTLGDFTPIAMVATQPTMLVVHPSLPVQSVKDLIALAKAQPGRINYGSGGNGSAFHLSAAWFAHMAQIDLVHVPYKGGALAVVALLGGEVKLAAASVPTVLTHVKSGKLRALAVTSAKRARLLPDLPTVAEAGVPGYDMNAWMAVYGPAVLPDAIATRLHGEIEAIQRSPDMRESLLAQGMEPELAPRSRLAPFMRSELEKYARIVDAIRESGALGK
jgi:tripartite-type tricarboxylate transporter receptor subunit TctC